MDEVYYFVDCFCGLVWEEVIFGFDLCVKIVGFLVIVFNVEEFGEWFDEVCGDVRVVVFECCLVLFV